ncbi:response regulator [candidate division KSB1 bacterium]
MGNSSQNSKTWQIYTVKVVAIDDDANSLEILKRYIEKSFPHVEYFCATNGEKGMRLIQEKLPDLILLDIQMRGLSGLDILKILKNYSPENIMSIPVMMITVVKDEVAIYKAKELGAVNYILKPYDREDLIKRLKPYLLA